MAGDGRGGRIPGFSGKRAEARDRAGGADQPQPPNVDRSFFADRLLVVGPVDSVGIRDLAVFERHFEPEPAVAQRIFGVAAFNFLFMVSLIKQGLVFGCLILKMLLQVICMRIALMLKIVVIQQIISNFMSSWLQDKLITQPT